MAGDREGAFNTVRAFVLIPQIFACSFSIHPVATGMSLGNQILKRGMSLAQARGDNTMSLVVLELMVSATNQDRPVTSFPSTDYLHECTCWNRVYHWY